MHKNENKLLTKYVNTFISRIQSTF